MAIIYPNDIHFAELESANHGELKTLSLLSKGLSKDFTVFHGYHWTNEGKYYTTFGEIDFIVVNKKGDVLVIEQKNGMLDESSAGLFKNYNNRSKSIPEQIMRAIDNIRDKYREQNGDGLIIDYLLYCPDYKVKDINSAGLGKGRVVDARHNLVDDIKRLHSTDKEDSNQYQHIIGFFKGELQVQPDVHQYIENQERTYTRLQSGLCGVISNLEMMPFRLRIKSTAGSGKTEVASSFFHDQIEKEKNTLLLCFNRPLADLLKKQIGDKGTVETWFGFCDQFLISRGHKLDYSKINEQGFWKDVLELVSVESIPDDWLFDTLIVDEGQDFQPEWVEVLRLFIREDSNILWLEDANQNIRYSESLDNLQLITYNANINFRAPRSIASFIQKVLPFEFESANTLPGLGVGVQTYQTEKDQLELVHSAVKDLVSVGFKLNEIVIITTKGVNNSVFSDVDKIGKWNIKHYDGYDGSQQVFTEGDLYFESIGRYKGQQSPAVIIVDVDPDESDHAKRLLFTAMTRATVRLDVLVKNDNKIRKIMQKAS